MEENRNSQGFTIVNTNRNLSTELICKKKKKKN